ncbi:hypothetical protein DXM27_20320 [Rhizobium rhizogenes]|uniref:Uncharacterized protein n=1 Tax=Rhizobium rhizogenes TaxID=359 RepID=A0AA88EXU8_RHIRH|nr:hypothetical protein DXM27_20320 [Rhizobium rhizogenes]
MSTGAFKPDRAERLQTVLKPPASIILMGYRTLLRVFCDTVSIDFAFLPDAARKIALGIDSIMKTVTFAHVNGFIS